MFMYSVIALVLLAAIAVGTVKAVTWFFDQQQALAEQSQPHVQLKKLEGDLYTWERKFRFKKASPEDLAEYASLIQKRNTLTAWISVQGSPA